MNDDITLPPSFQVELDDGRELLLTPDDCYVTARGVSARRGLRAVRIGMPELVEESLEGGELVERTVVQRGWAYLDDPFLITTGEPAAYRDNYAETQKDEFLADFGCGFLILVAFVLAIILFFAWGVSLL